MRYLIDFDVNERFQQSADLAAAEIVFCANLNRFICRETVGQLLNKITYIVRII